MACRYCDLRGIYNNHVYYPTTPPSNVINETYNPSNLPKRTHRDYKTRIEQIEKIPPLRTRNALASDLGNNLINIVFFAAKLTIIILKIGITGRSVLLDIKTTQFPACFPIDIMHLFYENIALYMLKHWMGSFFKDSTLNDQPYVLNNRQWNEIGAEMEAAKKSIPTDLGRPPRNIFLHYNGYKAEEWSSWITLYSLPLLKDRLPAKYIKGWSYFVKAVQLCQKRTLSLHNQCEIRNLLLRFYKHYEWYVITFILFEIFSVF